MTMFPTRIIAAIILLALAVSSYSQGAEPAVTLSVQADRPGARISPTMWGVFFEDINFGADGGLYAELVKNRSFEFTNPMMGWSNIPAGNMAGLTEIHQQDPFSRANPHYLRVKIYPGSESYGLSNEGFRGMGIREGEDYTFSAQVRAVEGRRVCESNWSQPTDASWPRRNSMVSPRSGKNTLLHYMPRQPNQRRS